MSKYFVEFIGTFFIVLSLVMTSISGLGNLTPLAVGIMLVVWIYAGIHISGGHYNPAVTISEFLRGNLEISEILPYTAAQVVGAVLAALIASPLLGALGAEEPVQKSITTLPALIAEFLGTFAIIYVFLNVTSAKNHHISELSGLIIGFTWIACHYAFGSISGGAFNPAFAIGMGTAGMNALVDIWIFLIGNLLAPLVAVPLYKYVNDING